MFYFKFTPSLANPLVEVNEKKISLSETLLSIWNSIKLYILLLLGLLAGGWATSSVKPNPFEKTDAGDPLPSNHSQWFLPLSGAFVLITFLSILELYAPQYFLQDDNLVQFLPVQLYSLEYFFCTGNFPTYNPLSYGGSPTYSLGIYALSYPPLYLAFIITKYGLGNTHYTTEVFAFLHLIAGYFILYALGRKLKAPPLLATIFALGHVTSGFYLIAGRCWYYMLPVATFWPLILLLSIAILQANSSKALWKNALILGFAIGLFFHAGNVQMWFYTLLSTYFLAAIYLISASLKPKEIDLEFGPVIGFQTKIIGLSISLIIGIGIASPLLWAMLNETQDLIRPKGFIDGIYNNLLSVFIPPRIVEASPPRNWGNLFREQAGTFYYAGSFLAFFGAIAFFLWGGSYLLNYLRSNLAKFKPSAFSNTESSLLNLKANIQTSLHLAFSVGALLTLLLVTGYEGKLSNILSKLPLVENFNFVFKWLPFFTLLITALGLVFIVSIGSKAIIKRISIALGLTYLALLPVVFTNCNYAFYTYGFKGYPELAKKTKDLLKNSQPFFFIGPDLDPRADYFLSQHHNLSLLNRFQSLQGYENLVNEPPFSHDWFLAFGLKSIITQLSPFDTTHPTVVERLAKYKEATKDLKLAIHSDTLEGRYLLTQVANASPICVLQPEEIQIRYAFHASGADIFLKTSNLSPKTSHILVALRFRKFWKCFTPSGKTLLPYSDAMGRTCIPVNPTLIQELQNKKDAVLRLRYEPW